MVVRRQEKMKGDRDNVVDRGRVQAEEGGAWGAEGGERREGGGHRSGRWRESSIRPELPLSSRTPPCRRRRTASRAALPPPDPSLLQPDWLSKRSFVDRTITHSLSLSKIFKTMMIICVPLWHMKLWINEFWMMIDYPSECALPVCTGPGF